MNRAVSYNTFNRQTPAPSRSVIDAWLEIVGNLSTEGEILVEGRIEGNVRCAQLIVGVDATVTGAIVAEEVIVYGKVKGAIRANKVILKDTAVVDSDIVHRSLTVERGACFDGSSCRRDQPLASETDAQAEDLRTAAAAMAHAETPAAETDVAAETPELEEVAA
ncbi:MAG: polymer-forming cytoskeletal protein [Hyphomicrobiaceae bacterium]|nr:polymer-forming cytoskeletal protein [Hyphomicrobiaceae bacterium]